MDIYIHNIKLPKDEPGAFKVIVLYVGFDGKLRAGCEGTHEVTVVPPHGRLIDADALIKPRNQHIDVHSDEWYVEVRTIEDAPTIIPAEEGE